MTIRPAELRDASEIARLSDVLGYPVNAEAIARRLKRLLDSPADIIFVAESGQGTLLGWIHGFLSQLVESEPRVEIGGLVVDAGARRQGVGRQLAGRVESWARGQGVAELSVRCREDRSEAHQFYDRLGFSCAKTQKVFRKRIDGR